MPVLMCLFLGACTTGGALFGVGAGLGAGVGVIGYQYYEGGVTVIYQAPMKDTWNGTLKAVKYMKFEIWSSDQDQTSGKIEAYRADGKPVTIYLEYESPRQTEVKIRVGYLGDRDAAMAIKEKIRKILFKE